MDNCAKAWAKIGLPPGAPPFALKGGPPRSKQDPRFSTSPKFSAEARPSRPGKNAKHDPALAAVGPGAKPFLIDNENK
jgi:hypothetical protein